MDKEQVLETLEEALNWIDAAIWEDESFLTIERLQELFDNLSDVQAFVEFGEDVQDD